MTRIAGWNVAALVGTLAASTALAWAPFLRPVPREPPRAVPTPARDPLRDRTGAVVPRRSYARIASASTVADAILLRLVAPERIVAFTGTSARDPVVGYAFAGKATIEDVADVERILALRPDLVLVNGVGDLRRLARLRDAGLVVFDLGEMRGLSTLVDDIRQIAALVERDEAGARLEREVRDRAATIAIDVPAADRRTGMFLAVYGGRLFGGASGTSYHDVLVTAGLVDAVAAMRDWPELTSEQVLRADPDVIVTDDGMSSALCGHAGLAALRACSHGGAVVEIEGHVLGSAGLEMLDAAQTLRDRVYGSPAGTLPDQGNFHR